MVSTTYYTAMQDVTTQLKSTTAPPPPQSQQLLTICTLVQAVDPKSRVHLLHLSSPDVGHRLDGVHATVLSKGHGDDLQGVSECSHGVLLQGRALEGTGLW